jgi:hypothetical protein
MDITATLAPKSDQLNSDDLIAGRALSPSRRYQPAALSNP